MKRDVGVQAIEQLLEKRRNYFDYILLETTGVADPLPIVKMFWLDDELHSDLILDGKTKQKKMQISYCLCPLERLLLNQIRI